MQDHIEDVNSSYHQRRSDFVHKVYPGTIPARLRLLPLVSKAADQVIAID